MDFYLMFTLLISLIGIIIYGWTFHELLLKFKVKSTLKKAMILSFALFIPYNILTYVISTYPNLWITFPWFLLLITGMLCLIKGAYKTEWKKTIYISFLWFISVLILGIIITAIRELIFF